MRRKAFCVLSRLQRNIRDPDMRLKLNRFWFSYFCVRIVYLLFTVFVYGRVSTLGDTDRYLAGGAGSVNGGFSSTALMDRIGGLASRLAGGNPLLSNLPFMLLSFFCIRWAVDALCLRQRMNRQLLFVLLSLPNFCIWTSVCSKECFGLWFSAILGVLFAHFLQGDFRLRRRDWLGAALCLIFKAQYFPFIIQALAFVWLSDKLALKASGQLLLGLLFISVDIGVLYFIRPLVDDLSFLMYAHFDSAGAQSTRDDIFLQAGDFYRNAPRGMFLAFFGPTLKEMIRQPMHLIAGLESLFILLLLFRLIKRSMQRLFLSGHFSPRWFFAVFLVVTGICFIHYPFGIFNPGSAIRYRTNFLFLFILVLSEWHIHDRTCYR